MYMLWLANLSEVWISNVYSNYSFRPESEEYRPLDILYRIYSTQWNTQPIDKGFCLFPFFYILSDTPRHIGKSNDIVYKYYVDITVDTTNIRH